MAKSLKRLPCLNVIEILRKQVPIRSDYEENIYFTLILLCKIKNLHVTGGEK